MEHESLTGQVLFVRAHSHGNGTRCTRTPGTVTVVPFLVPTYGKAVLLPMLDTQTDISDNSTRQTAAYSAEAANH